MKTSTIITTTIINDSSDESEMLPWDEIVARLFVKSTLIDIARKTHCDERILSNLKNGVTIEPKFSTGVQLLALHGLWFPYEHKRINHD